MTKKTAKKPAAADTKKPLEKESKSKRSAAAEPVAAAPTNELGEDSDEDEADAAGGEGEMSGELAAQMNIAKGGPVPESSASFKNFRHHPDMENFYRFIYENDLRYEALGIIDKILIDKHEKKKALLIKAKVH